VLRRSALTGFAGDASGGMGGLGGFEWRRTDAAALEPAEWRAKKSRYEFYGATIRKPTAECQRPRASAIQLFAAQPNQKLHSPPRMEYSLIQKKAPRASLRGALMQQLSSDQAPILGYQYSTRRLLNRLPEQSKLMVKLPAMSCVAVHSVAPSGWALFAQITWPVATKLPRA
jgi:hypothetical protein